MPNGETHVAPQQLVAAHESKMLDLKLKKQQIQKQIAHEQASFEKDTELIQYMNKTKPTVPPRLTSSPVRMNAASPFSPVRSYAQPVSMNAERVQAVGGDEAAGEIDFTPVNISELRILKQMLTRLFKKFRVRTRVTGAKACR